MRNRVLNWELGIAFLLTCGLLGGASRVQAETSVHVGIHRHLHQPNYWGEPVPGRPEQSQYGQDSQALKDAGEAYYGDTIQHPEVLLVGGNDSVFENPDKQSAYQRNIKSSIGAMNSPDAGMTISYSGALQRNLWSFGRYNEAGYTPGWNDNNVEAYGWKTSGGVNSRAQVLGQTYHHSFTPLLPESALRKEIEMQRERTRKSWGLNSDMSDQPVGFWPIELAFSEQLIPILAEYGYDWVMIPNSHLARTCPEYMDALAQPDPGAELKADPPNRADQLGPSVPLEQWYGANRDTYGNVFPVPFSYQLHKAKFVNPETGTESKITIVPQCDYHGYQSGYGTVGWEYIDGIIAQYNDPDHPSLVMLTNDGENYWGGGSSFWNEFAPQFMNDAPSHGKKAITIQDFVDAHPAPDADVVHVEDGSWLAADQGSPQFYRWLEPPRRISGIDWSDPYSIFDLENGWHTDMRNWAIMLAGVNHCETAEQIFEDGGGEVASWRIEEPVQDDGTSNNPNDAEQAWHFLLWGFDSGFLYFGDTLDDEVKHTVAANRAISFASNIIGDASADTTPPVIFKPQRFPWNPGGKGKGQYLDGLTTGGATVGFTTPVWSSDFYIWTFAYDVSGVSSVTLKIRVDEDGTNPLADNANETYAGGSGVSGWVSIPMTRRAMPKDDPTGNSNLNYYVLPDQISDYCWAKVTGYRDVLLDYYIESTDSKGNLQKSDIQHVYVEDDGTQGGQHPSASFEPAAPADCAPLTVTFNAETSVLAQAATVYAAYHFSTNADDWITTAMTREDSNTFSITFTTNDIPDNAPQLEIAFNDGINWESNGGANWSVVIRDCDAPFFTNGVSLTPAMPAAGQSVTVSYDPTGRALAAATAVNIHYGYNGDNWTVAPGEAMTKPAFYWTFTYTIPEAATNIDLVFNDGTDWDSNSDNNWVYPVTPADPEPPVPDGMIITNPAVGTTTVAYAVTNYTLQGTAGTNLTGSLIWTNSAGGGNGLLAHSSHWVLPATLSIGENVITLSGQIAGTGSSVTTTSAVDSASAYTNWTNGSNKGTGFGPWVMNHTQDGITSFAGTFIGNPTNAAISGFGPEAFGFYANPPTSGANAEVTRELSSAMSVGDSLQFELGLNWDSNNEGSNRGFHLLAGTTELVNLNMGNSEVITINGETLFANYGSQALPLKFDYVSDGSIRVQATGRDGAETYDTILPVPSGVPDGIKFYFNATDSAANERQMYFDNLRVTHETGGGDEEYSVATVHIIRESDGAPVIPIPPIVFEPGTGFSFDVPARYDMERVEGADTLVGKAWNWAPLAEDTDYTITVDGKLTILSTGSETHRMIRIWLAATPP